MLLFFQVVFCYFTFSSSPSSKCQFNLTYVLLHGCGPHGFHSLNLGIAIGSYMGLKIIRHDQLEKKLSLFLNFIYVESLSSEI